MLLGEHLEHILRRGDGLGFAASRRGRQSQVREQHEAELLGRIDVETLAGQLEDSLADARQLAANRVESLPSTSVSMRTPAFSMR